MFVATFQGHVVVPFEFKNVEQQIGLGTITTREDGTPVWDVDETEVVLMVRAQMCDHHHGHFATFLASELVIVNKRTDPEKMSEVTGWGKCCRELMIAEIFKGRTA